MQFFKPISFLVSRPESSLSCCFLSVCGSRKMLLILLFSLQLPFSLQLNSSLYFHLKKKLFIYPTKSSILLVIKGLVQKEWEKVAIKSHTIINYKCIKQKQNPHVTVSLQHPFSCWQHFFQILQFAFNKSHLFHLKKGENIKVHDA